MLFRSERQIAGLSRADETTHSLREFGCLILVRDEVEACRIADLIGGELTEGDYQLLFDLAGYRGDDAFLQGLAVALRVTDAGRSYHVPLLLAPYGATVYRGS